jgi:outer membrane receptor for ferrienterochelin and colicin
LIDSFTVNPGLLSYANFDKASYEGLEVSGRFKLSRNLITSIGLNWLNNRDSDENLLPNTIPFSVNSTVQLLPLKNSFSFFSNIKIITPYTPQVYNSDEGVFVKGVKKIDRYLLMNLSGSLNFTNKMKLSVGIDNLGDYTNETYGPYLGRKIYFQISSKIN